MGIPPLPQEGGCRCGKVRFKVTAPSLITMACHCTGCQRMTASAFSLSAAFSEDGFSLTQGEPIIGGLHGADRHYFCAHCMSWMYTRPDGLDNFVNVRATLFDDASWCAPFIETWTDEKQPYAPKMAAHSYAKDPPEEDIPGLLEAFAAENSPQI